MRLRISIPISSHFTIRQCNRLPKITSNCSTPHYLQDLQHILLHTDRTWVYLHKEIDVKRIFSFMALVAYVKLDGMSKLTYLFFSDSHNKCQNKWIGCYSKLGRDGRKPASLYGEKGHMQVSDRKSCKYWGDSWHNVIMFDDNCIHADCIGTTSNKNTHEFNESLTESLR